MSTFRPLNNVYPGASLQRYTVSNTTFNTGSTPDVKAIIPGGSFMSITNETVGTTVQISFDGVNVADEITNGAITSNGFPLTTATFSSPAYVWLKVTSGSATVAVRVR